MPSMKEIYGGFADNYDELVDCEDYQGNLKDLLHSEINWKQKTVYEAGIGTGRVSKLFIENIKFLYGFDISGHMLSKARENLNGFSGKIDLRPGENSNLPLIEEKADIFIEGWSFGHTIIDNSENSESTFQNIYTRIIRNLKPCGKIIIIESLGTNVESPAIIKTLEDFYLLLENRYQFCRNVVRTDYKFKSVEEASRITGFFFGDQMGEEVRRQGRMIVPEFTGVWTKEI